MTSRSAPTRIVLANTVQKINAQRHAKTLFRLTWAALVLLTVALFGAGLPEFHRVMATPCHTESCNLLQLSQEDAQTASDIGLSLGLYAAFFSAQVVVTVGLFIVTSALIVWRKPNNRMAEFVSIGFVTWGPTYTASVTEALVAAYPWWSLPVSLLQGLGIWLLLVFGFIFPNGRFVPRWSRYLAIAAVAITIALAMGSPTRIVSFPETALEVVLSRVQICLMIAAALALVYRYRWASNPIERQQIKWIVFGFSAFVVEIIAYLLLPDLLSPLQQPGLPRLAYLVIGSTINVLFLVMFVMSFAIAMLRYRLFELDVIINRALVYSALTLALSLFYWASVVALQHVFGTLAGSTSSIAIVISTLAIAFLFQPLRRRFQAEVDQRFYRSRYDSTRVLSRFGAEVRDQVDLDALTKQLEMVVAQTMRPAHTSVWLRNTTSAHHHRRGDGTVSRQN
jgi:hypothetical protein